MFITVDILQKRGACQEYLDYFQKHYPNGVEMLYMIEKAHTPIDNLFWGYDYLDPGAEEVAAYNKKLQIINSIGVYHSVNIYNSEAVSESENVENSKYIYRSFEIKNSKYISDSALIENCKYISSANFVNNSDYILNSDNINNCKNICQSNFITDSFSIFKSNNILQCNSIWNSENLTNCYFSMDCLNSKHLLFCLNLKDAEYYLFNKPIERERFEVIKKQFLHYVQDLNLAEDWDIAWDINPKLNHDYRKHTKNIPNSFWAWVKTLPGYDPMVMYSITFDPQFLH
jgi:hypothetical protein